MVTHCYQEIEDIIRIAANTTTSLIEATYIFTCGFVNLLLSPILGRDGTVQCRPIVPALGSSQMVGALISGWASAVSNWPELGEVLWPVYCY